MNNQSNWKQIFFSKRVTMTVAANVYRKMCHQTSNISRTLVGNKIVDHSDVGVTPTTSSFSAKHLASMDWQNNGKTRRWTFRFWDLVRLILNVWWHFTKTFFVSKRDFAVVLWHHTSKYLLWGKPTVTGGFPSQMPVTMSFDFFYDLRLNKP